MKIDENDFFRQATLRISSSLDIEKATRNSMNYLQQYIPIAGMYFFMYNPDLNVAHWLASIGPVNMPEAGATISLPNKYGDELKERFSEEAQVKFDSTVSS